jgi:hypothetical protein
MIVKLRIGGGILRAVPAVPYRFEFADLVNQSVHRTPGLKAVAVGLGQGAVDALTSWMRELRVAPGDNSRRRLPCMFGLIRSNRRIHTKYKQAALRLQESYGLPLHRIPPRILRAQIGFSSLSLICLSPTDSIIEAIRVAIEHNLPVFGVDLEDFAGCDRKSIMVEDPQRALDNLDGYIRRNALYCSNECRDEEVDGRRERVMAGSLKHLVREYGDVLFTGGLAHWVNLSKSLMDRAIPASASLPRRGAEAYEQVLVDPVLAIRQMDLFPYFSRYFEESLRGTARDTEGDARRVYQEFSIWFRSRYRDAAGGAATATNGNDDGRGNSSNDEDDGEIKNGPSKADQTGTEQAAGVENGDSRSRRQKVDPEAFENCDSFFQYFGNLCLVNQQMLPDITTTINAAAAVVSDEFAQRLAKQLITNGTNWETPAKWPNLPYLRSLPLDPDESGLTENSQKAELLRKGKRSGPFFVDGRAGDNAPRLSVRLDDTNPPLSGDGGGGYDDKMRRGPNAWIWPPCENLFYGTAYQAAEIALTTSARGTTEPFEGTLHEGIDAKATIRAAARGDGRVFVRAKSTRPPSSIREAQSEPFVYLFDSKERSRYSKLDWSMTVAGNTFNQFLQPKYVERFEQVKRTLGYGFVACVILGEQREVDARLATSRYFDGIRLLWGAVGFGNPCLNAIQSARWLEQGDFNCCPVMGNTSCHIGEMVEMYKDRHGMNLDLTNWPETLVRIAIPYARERIVVIAPDPSIVSSRARMEARQHRISIDVLPLSYFSAERIRAIRTQYNVYPMNADATEWSSEVTSLLAQSSNAHSDILPAWVREQTRENC